jgi:hypothetical protein
MRNSSQRHERRPDEKGEEHEGDVNDAKVGL